MPDERKRPGAGVWAAASVGPVVWGFSRIDDPPQWLTTVAEGYIAPARFVHDTLVMRVPWGGPTFYWSRTQ